MNFGTKVDFIIIPFVVNTISTYRRLISKTMFTASTYTFFIRNQVLLLELPSYSTYETKWGEGNIFGVVSYVLFERLPI